MWYFPCCINFKEFMPEKVRDELSTMQDIQYHIDLIFWASLPNLPHYRINPTESKILKQKVEELLRNEHIQESIVLFAILKFLTPKNDGKQMMCTDIRAINKVTMDYKFFIPRLYNVLDRLQGHFYSRLRAGWITYLQENWLYINLNKYIFMANKLLFLGYVVYADRIQVDKAKIKAIQDWLAPTNISLYGLANF